MDVNRDNFHRVLPEILQDITDADYVAMDGEFTGIIPLNRMGYFDTPAERYRRHYEFDRPYLMIQMGLAMIRCINPAENRYSIKAYNFYLFPENEMDAFDFRSKSSSLQFLAANHFDFTQLFLKGIPFVCKSICLEKLRQQHSFRIRNHQTSNRNNASRETISANPSDAELLSKRMNGFSEVIWKLQESGKPVIGHNLHMDIFHIINQFFTPVPPSYEEYKLIIKSLFPKLIDTKTIASTSIFQSIISNTALNALYKSVREQDFPRCCFEAPENFSYALGEHEHTAGYDATCTAICMASMMAYIAEQTSFKANPIEHPLVDSFIGKFFYMCSFDLRYSDMINDDDLPDRSAVFYVKHPLPWSTLNIREYFQRWGFPICERYDSITHIVGMSSLKETIDTILPQMRAMDTNLVITPYAQFNHLDLSKMKIRQPNHLFDLDPTKRNSNKRNRVDAQNIISTSPMDIAIPILDPLAPRANHITTSSTTYQSTQQSADPTLNESKRKRV